MQAVASVRQMLRARPHHRLRSRLRVVTLPKNFEQAVLRGWKVVSEKSNLEADKRHRWGMLMLAQPGQSRRLSIGYTASVKLGYEFGQPQFL